MRVGQIGYGYWGPNLFRNLVALDGAEVVAVADLDPARLTPLMDGRAGLQLSTDHRELLARPDVDAVVIATPAPTHGRLGAEALLAGKHVLIEKPLAMSVTEAQRLVDLACERSLTLMVEHTFVYSRAVAWLKDQIDGGRVGEVRYLHSQRLNLGRAQADVDALWNVGPHDVSIALHLLGELPAEVSARGASYLRPGVADVVFFAMTYSDGRLAHCHLSWLDPVKVRRTTVVGTRAAVVYDDTAAEAPIALFDRAIALDGAGGADAGAQPRTHRGDVILPALPSEEPLRAACRHFVDCVHQRRPTQTDGRHGLDVVRVLAAAARSMADGGRPVAVGKD